MGEEEFVCESRTDSLNLSVRRNPDWRVSVVFVKKNIIIIIRKIQ